MITEKLRASLEQILHTYFTEDWTVQKRQNKLIISWQAHEEISFTITWNNHTKEFNISGSDIPTEMLLTIIDHLEKQKEAIMSKPKIIVLGGSFNPPTIAHVKILQTAVTQLNAEYGIFVPSSDAYVTRKMKKQKSNIIFTEKEREQMLKTSCKSCSKLKVSTIEFGSTSYSGHTYETMCQLQEEYPNHELYFIFGSDKIEVFTRWSTYEQFVNKFKIIIFTRNNNNIISTINTTPKLKMHKNAFIMLPPPEDISHISSTAVRTQLEKQLPCNGLLQRDVYNIAKQKML